MKKFMIPGIIIILIIGFILFIQHVNINRIGADNYYVQIKGAGEKITDKADNGQEYVSYKYTLPAYDKNGNEKQVSFTAIKQLREKAYLNLFIKGEKGVTSYQEVKLKDIPNKVKEKLK